ncbi:MAG: DUF1800 domain-containing protein [Sphingomonas sp.]|nr:DUF1800 domain-containing protein [Sphingomonas sp.]
MDAAIALNRFGLGRRPSDDLPDDPHGWLESQLSRYQPALPGRDAIAGQTEIAQGLVAFAEQARAAGKMQVEPAGTVPGPVPDRPVSPQEKVESSPATTQDMRTDRQQIQADLRAFARTQYLAQVSLRVRNAVATDTPFVERLVHFWANHFAVSADKPEMTALAGLLEFDAIRPNLLGRFEDMLVAVERHPAMLIYLDQAQSVGPNSPFGARAQARGRKAGLNENLGREILELHTLGVRSGYSQSDVTEFARALTGWTVAGFSRGGVAPRLMDAHAPGDFLFLPAVHEPGSRTIVSKVYREEGEGQARAVLRDLARHPATARHVATKLARHFVADDPPAALVAKLESAYRSSDGHLATVYAALIAAPEAWQNTYTKFRTPWLWGVAVMRSLDMGAQASALPDRNFVSMFADLGQPVWRPGSPAGFDDIASAWAAPDALYRRVEIAGRLASRAGAAVDARDAAARLFGDRMSDATRRAIANADSPREGVALMLVAPEMLRC